MSKNDVTGDRLVTKAPNSAYDEGYDRIFKKKVQTAMDGGDYCDFTVDKGVMTVVGFGAVVDQSVPKPPPGYTAEELELDNPYNQWIHEK